MSADEASDSGRTFAGTDDLTHEDGLILGLHRDSLGQDGVVAHHCSLVVTHHGECHTGLIAGVHIIIIGGSIVRRGHRQRTVLHRQACRILRRAVVGRISCLYGDFRRGRSHDLGIDGQDAYLFLTDHAAVTRSPDYDSIGADIHRSRLLVRTVEIDQRIVAAGWNDDVIVASDGHGGCLCCTSIGLHIITNGGGRRIQRQLCHIQLTHLRGRRNRYSFIVDKCIVVTHGGQDREGHRIFANTR